MTSTPVTRGAKRDYWNNPQVVRNCKRLDTALLVFIVASIMLAGSLFN